MLVTQIGFEANNINRALDELRSRPGRRQRQALLNQALYAAQRALLALQEEPLVTRTAAYVAETLERHDRNPYAVAEELRLDRALIWWFIKADCDLLRAERVDGHFVDAIERDMFEVLNRPLGQSPESLIDQFRELMARVEWDLVRLQEEGERSEIHRTLAMTLGVLGGCAVVAADTAATAATAGGAAPLLAVSIPVGAEILNRSLSMVLE